MQRTHIRCENEELASNLLNSMVEMDLEDQHYKGLKRIMTSKQIFESTEYTMALEIDHGKDRKVLMPMSFPDRYASFYEYNTQMHGNETNASFFVNHPEYVIVNRKHLPTYSEINNTVKVFKERFSGKFADDGPCSSKKRFLRPHVENIPDDDSSLLNIIGEAELAVPFVIGDNQRFRFVIQGFEGTDGTEKKTDWITGEELVSRCNHVFALRKRMLDKLSLELKRVGKGGDVHISPHALLHQGICIAYATEEMDVTEEFFTGKDLSVRDQNHCILGSFSLFWRELPNGKRALAIGSASVAFTHKKATSGLECCHTCLGDIEGSHWKCTSCKQPMHHECNQLWIHTCIARSVPPSCPICRAAISA